MKILQINKFFYHKGGTETYLFSLIWQLQKAGHSIVGFSQKNKNNIDIAGSELFIDEINLDKFYFNNIFKIGRIFWSLSAKKNITKLINQEKIDLVHIHNIYHQISPSILPVIKKAGIPIVMTVHDFKLISPHYTLGATKNLPHLKPLLARALMFLEYAFHKSIKIYKKNVDLFIAPSEFVRRKLITAGFEANKIIVLPHFIEQDNKIKNSEEKNYIVCFGRLDKSKGVDILIKAWAQIKSELTLKIIGSGPDENNLKQLARDLEIENKIEFIPHCHKPDLESIIAQSWFTVFPSLVHETFGLGVIESYFQGKPVIATKVGAFTENVIENKTGLLVAPANIMALKNALEKMISDIDLRKSMGQSAKAMAQNKFTPQIHLNKINDIYNSVVEKSTAKKNHYAKEKKYAQEIMATTKGEARNQIIAQAYDEINDLVNNYQVNGIRGHYKSTFNLIASLASKNDQILDYGCGGGELVAQLNNYGYKAQGFDVASDTVETAKIKTGLNDKFITGDLNKITNQYDLIVMDNVIEHIAPDEIKDILNKLKNILKNNGQLLIITPHRFSGPHDISGHFLKLGAKARGLHLKEFDLKGLVREVKECNYNSVSGYLVNPRLTEKIRIRLKPNKLWLKKSLVLEKLFNFKICNWILKINKTLTKILIAGMFPTIIIAKK